MSVMRICFTLALLTGSVVTLAAPAFEVIGLHVVRGDSGGFQPDATTVEFRVTGIDAHILGLYEDSAIDVWSDDTGADLLQPVTPPDDIDGMQVISNITGNIRQDRVSVGENGKSILIMAVTPARPAAGASTLSLRGTLNLRVAGEGEKTVTLEDVSFEAGGWGNDLEVDGEKLGCRLDSASSSTGTEDISRFYCYGPALRPLRIVARGSENIEVPGGNERPNLIVIGPTEGLTIDVSLPRSESLEVPVDLDVGLGLGG